MSTNIPNDQIAKLYQEQTNQVGTKGGNVTDIAYDEGNGVLNFTEDDGDVIALKIEDLSDANLDSLKEQFGIKINADAAADKAGAVDKADKADNANAADKADGAEEAGKTGEIDAKKAELEKLQNDWNGLDAKAKDIEAQIEKISKEIEKDLSDILKQQEEVTKEEKERIEDIVAEKIAQFKEDVANGKNVTADGLLAEISEAISSGGKFDTSMMTIKSNMEALKGKIGTMETLVGDLANVKTEMDNIQSEIGTVEKEVEDLEKAEQEAESCKRPPCDPIGFVDEEGTKFEFVIDKDGNEELSSAKEFLGADDTYNELIALDTEGGENGKADGVVSREELEKTEGLMVLVTTKDGKQELKTMQEAFGDKDVSIDLKSMNKYDGQNKVSDLNGQTLLADFNINVGGKDYTGYSTLDSAEYLEENYEFTDGLGLEPENAEAVDGANAADGVAKADGEEKTNAEIMASHEAFGAKQKAAIDVFKEQYDTLEEILDIDKTVIDSTIELVKTVAEFAANKLINKFESAEAEAKEREKVLQAANKAAEAEAKAANEEDKVEAKMDVKDADAAEVEGEEKDENEADKPALNPNQQTFEEILEEILGDDKAKPLEAYRE